MATDVFLPLFCVKVPEAVSVPNCPQKVLFHFFTLYAIRNIHKALRTPPCRLTDNAVSHKITALCALPKVTPPLSASPFPTQHSPITHSVRMCQYRCTAEVKADKVVPPQCTAFQIPHVCVLIEQLLNTGLFVSPSGISDLDCATTKTDTAERSISIGRESLQVFFLIGALAYLQVPPLGGSHEEKWRSQ